MSLKRLSECHNSFLVFAFYRRKSLLDPEREDDFPPKKKRNDWRAKKRVVSSDGRRKVSLWKHFETARGERNIEMHFKHARNKDWQGLTREKKPKRRLCFANNTGGQRKNFSFLHNFWGEKSATMMIFREEEDGLRAFTSRRFLYCTHFGKFFFAIVP